MLRPRRRIYLQHAPRWDPRLSNDLFPFRSGACAGTLASAERAPGTLSGSKRLREYLPARRATQPRPSESLGSVEYSRLSRRPLEGNPTFLTGVHCRAPVVL